MSIRKTPIGVAFFATAVLMSSAVLAGEKDVIVINTPDVKVVNDENEPVPVMVQNTAKIVEYRYIGVTEFESNGLVEFGGLVGIAAMNKVCNAEFGPSSRAASIAEAFWRDDPQDLRKGWLVPRGPMSFVKGTAIGTDFFAAIDSSSGVAVSAEGNADAVTAGLLSYCGRYTQANEQGSVTTFGAATGGTGAVSGSLCDNIQPIACSAPVAIPISP
jgi:hypothetical protein